MEIPLDQLPLYSPWPKRLLGLESFPQRSKTRGEVLREYNDEKWKNLLKNIKDDSATATLDSADRLCRSADPSVVYSRGSELFLGTPAGVDRLYRELIQRAVSSVGAVSALVELGCGYGSILFSLAKTEGFTGHPLFGAEFTNNGRKALKAIARSEKIDVTVGKCDFTESHVTSMRIPPGALIFTSMALHCVPKLPATLMATLWKMRPAALILVEPCYEHYLGDSLLDLLRRKYVEVNDYNRNLLTLVREAESCGMFESVVESCVFGHNPLFPCSWVTLIPRGDFS